MFISRVLIRRIDLRLKRRSSHFIHLIVLLAIFVFLYDKFILNDYPLQPKIVVVSNDLLNYNEDHLRTGWPFKMNKHYDVSEMRSYTSKPKFISGLDWPGENGNKKTYFELKFKRIINYKNKK